MAKSAKKAQRAVQNCYPNLVKLLPIVEVVDHLYRRELLSANQKSKFGNFTLREEKIRYFLDEILIPGLTIDYTGHFDEMVIMMTESDDVLTRCLVKKLITPDGASDNASETDTLSTADTGMEWYYEIIMMLGHSWGHFIEIASSFICYIFNT